MSEAQGKKYYGKIYCEEGVVTEREFSSREAAVAYVLGFTDAEEILDDENDFFSACVGDTPAEDEEARAQKESK